MNQDKLAFFVTKFRALNEEEFVETCRRSSSLAEEAEAAVRQVASERGNLLPNRSQDTGETATELSNAERSEQTRQSSEIWNSTLSKRVQLQFGFHAIVFSGALLGTSGLRFGAFWLLVVCVVLYYFANKIGRNYTRSICANDETSIKHKLASLRTSSIVLWPTLIVAALLGAGLASMLGGP